MRGSVLVVALLAASIAVTSTATAIGGPAPPTVCHQQVLFTRLVYACVIPLGALECLAPGCALSCTADFPPSRCDFLVVEFGIR